MKFVVVTQSEIRSIRIGVHIQPTARTIDKVGAFSVDWDRRIRY